MITAIIIGLIIVILFFIGFTVSSGSDDMNVGIIFGVLITILCVIEINIINDIMKESKPTFEYYIKDEIKIDNNTTNLNIY